MSSVIDPKVDIYVNGDWTEITTGDNGVREKTPIRIIHGAKGEDLKASPARASMVLNDPNGDYNRRNPMGAYHGSLNKNTPLRIRVPLLVDNVSQTVTDGWGTAGTNHTSSTGFSWDNGAALGGTIADTDWSRSGTAKTNSLPVADCYRETDLDGTESFRDLSVKYTIQVPVSNITGGYAYHILKLRKSDSDNYAEVSFQFLTNETVSMFILDNVDGDQHNFLPETVISGLSVATDQKFWINVSMTETVLRAKIWAFGDAEPLDWLYTYTRFERRSGNVAVRNGLSGNSNTKPFLMVMDNFSIEARPFTGEISTFTPGTDDESLRSYYMGITATGPMQRYEQGATPFKSSVYREFSSSTRFIREGATVVTTADGNSFTSPEADAADIAPVGGTIRFLDRSYSDFTDYSLNLNIEDEVFVITNKSTSLGVTTVTFYPEALNPPKANDFVLSSRSAGAADLPFVFWPCDDGKEATQINSGLIGGAPMTYSEGVPQFGAMDLVTGSLPVLKLNGAELYSALPDYDNSLTELTFHCFMSFPSDEDAATGTDIVQFYTDSPTGEINWELVYETGGSGGDLRIRVSNSAGTILFQNVFNADIRGKTRQVTLSLSETGGVVSYSLVSMFYPQTLAFFIDGTVTGVTVLGKASRLRINPGGGYINVGIGGIMMFPSFMDNFNFIDPERSYLFEDIGYRLLRLSTEENIPITFCSYYKQPSQLLGFQLTETLLNNLREPVKVNRGGFFYESRDAYSFEYRTTPLIFNQEEILNIDFMEGGVLVDFIPIDDDQNTRNNVTVSRQKGGQLQLTQTEGPLSIEAPPDGVGTYSSAPSLMIPMDKHLERNASWELHLGTVDEYRYSVVKLFPTETNIPLEKMFSIGVGTRIKITNASTSAARAFDTIDQIVVGFSWNLHTYRPFLELNCIPASPFNIIELDNTDYSIIDQEESTLAEALDTTETAIDISTTDNNLWATTSLYPDAFPFNALIAKAGMTTGEQITVTACVGSTPGANQTLTVVRGVNGVVRDWDSGDSIFVLSPVYLPM